MNVAKIVIYNLLLWSQRILYLFLLLVCVTGCSKKHETPANDIWDIDKYGIPEFVKTNFIELPKIYRISKYRSV